MNYYPQLNETVHRAVLPNGLTVITVSRKGFRKKLAYFAADYGAIHRLFRLSGKEICHPAGIAHYLEHKMFDMPEGEVSEQFARLGAMVNAFTSYDMTAYYFSCTEHFEESLQLLLEFVSTPYFTAESVQKEQGIIGQEIAMSADNPDSKVFENLMGCLYARHRIRETILGTAESIAQITPQILEQCHRAFYRPENMVLCVVGDVDPAAIEAMAAAVLPGLGALGEKCRDWAEEMAALQPYTEQAMDVAMPMFCLGFKCESIGAGAEAARQEILGELAAEALFGESSGLYLKLYEAGLIDSSFGGGFETVDGMAMLIASGDSLDPEAVQEAILQQAQLLAEEGIPEKDLLRMKRSALGRRIRDLDSFDSTCFRLCAYHFLEVDYMEFPQLYQQVESRDIQEFLRRVVTRERCGLSVIVPRDQTEETP